MPWSRPPWSRANQTHETEGSHKQRSLRMPCGNLLDIHRDDEALGVLAPLDDVDRQARHRFGGTGMEDRSRIGGIGEPLAQEGELPEQGAQQQHAAIAVLNVGRGDQRVQHQAEGVDQKVALLAVDQLAAIEARRVDAGAPFSALLTLWLSITQAGGLISRSACSRHLMESASWIRFSVPSQLQRQK